MDFSCIYLLMTFYPDVCCCGNLMFYDWRECMMSTLGTTKTFLVQLRWHLCSEVVLYCFSGTSRCWCKHGSLAQPWPWATPWWWSWQSRHRWPGSTSLSWPKRFVHCFLRVCHEPPLFHVMKLTEEVCMLLSGVLWDSTSQCREADERGLYAAFGMLWASTYVVKLTEEVCRLFCLGCYDHPPLYVAKLTKEVCTPGFWGVLASTSLHHEGDWRGLYAAFWGVVSLCLSTSQSWLKRFVHCLFLCVCHEPPLHYVAKLTEEVCTLSFFVCVCHEPPLLYVATLTEEVCTLFVCVGVISLHCSVSLSWLTEEVCTLFCVCVGHKPPLLCVAKLTDWRGLYTFVCVCVSWASTALCC